MKFKDLLYSPSALVKDALETPDEVKFEYDFSNLGYAFLKDKASNLLPYLIGFETIEREEDGSKAVGVFGFKVGNKFYYVPTFFSNGQIRGMDLLYCKDTNMFMPLTEEFINKDVLDKQNYVLGEVSPEQDLKTLENPNFRFLAVPPNARKYACDISYKELIKSAFETWNNICNELKNNLENDSIFQEMFGNAIQSISEYDIEFTKKGELHKFLENNDPKYLLTFLNTIEKNRKFLKAASVFYVLPNDFDITFNIKKAEDKIKIITTSNDISDVEDGRKLIRDGFVIRDSRDDNEKTKIITDNVVVTEYFSNPEKCGVYDAIVSNGSIGKIYVFTPIQDVDNKDIVVRNDKNLSLGRERLVISDDGSFYCLCKNSDIVVDPDSYKSFDDIGSSLDDLTVGNTYCLFSLSGEALIVDISLVIVEKDKPTVFSVYSLTKPYVNKIIISDRKTNKISFYKDSNYDYVAVVPRSWKCLKLDKVKHFNFLGSLSDIYYNFYKIANFHDFVVYSNDGLEFTFCVDGFSNNKPVGYKSAVIELVTKYGFDESDAVNLLKKAALNNKAKCWVKFGQLVGVSMPNPIPPTMGMADIVNIPMEIDQNPQILRGTTVGAPPVNYNNPYLSTDRGLVLSDDVVELAQNAAMSGQKRVFDVASIMGLVEVHDVASLIDTFLPAFYDTLDKLGRVLFLFYWKNSEFIDRYGKDNIQTLEDSLRNVFKSFGNMILKLKEKSIDTETLTLR